MFNNVVLDVFIGLIFLFLLYSLLVTVIQEIIANILALRGRMLSKGIKRMLEDGSGQTAFHSSFFEHPAIKYLGENNVFRKPAYIEARTFAQTLIHLLRGADYTNVKSQMDAIKLTLDQGGNGIAPQTLAHLRNLYVDAQNDIDRFRAKLEEWYDDTMDRVTGWYKRQTQWILIGIGLALAVIGNIDVIKIYGILSRDKVVREQMVNMAIASQKTYAPLVDSQRQKQNKAAITIENTAENTSKDTLVSDSKRMLKGQDMERSSSNCLVDPQLTNTFNELKKDADNASSVLGLGWYTSPSYKKYVLVSAQADSVRKAKDTTGLARLDAEKRLLEDQISDTFSASSIPGWIILALAVSLGAPFWFDLLNKFINLRNAGVKPDDASVSSTAAISVSAKGEQIRVVEKNVR